MNKDYYQIVKEKTNNQFELIKYVDYESSQNVIKCNRCGNTFKSSVHQLLRKKKLGHCPFCEISAKSPTKEQAEYKIKQAAEDDYKLIKFSGSFSKNKSVFYHSKCGKEFKMAITTFISNKERCPFCQHRSFKYNNDEVDKMIMQEDPNYIRISDYQNYDAPLTFKHLKCGNEFNMSLHNFLSHSRCPKCWRIINRSIGENIIKNFLNQNNIKYICEYSFPDCKNIRTLNFDFYLPEYNMCIEYDGKQHFFEYDKFGGLPKLNKMKQNDFIKNDYCKNNNIDLLRIKYNLNENKLYEILNQILISNYSTTKLDNIEEYYNNYKCKIYYHKTIKANVIGNAIEKDIV